jgi:hypothetical protein
LPTEKQKIYNLQRRSKVFVKKLWVFNKNATPHQVCFKVK